MENTKVTPPQLGKPKIKQRNKKVFVDVSQRADIKLLEAIKSNKVDEINSILKKYIIDFFYIFSRRGIQNCLFKCR